MAIGAIGALFVVGKFPPWTIAGNDHKEQPPSFDSRFSGQDARNAAQSKPVVPQLNLGRGAALKAGEAFPLGNSLSGTVEGASLVIEGLASGSMVTAGRSWGANTWRIPVTDLQDARVHPPRDYSGPMDLIVELRLADDTVADRKLLHLEWAAAAKPVPAVVAKSAPAVATTPPSPAAAAPSAPAAAAPSAPAAAAPSAPVAATPPTPIRYLERDEISDLVRRGEAFIASGDLASARLVLQRAAEAGDAKAALTLAGTYDPITLEKLGIYGFASDIGKARAWYERAKAFGSAEASQRLEMLVSRDH